MFSTISSDLDDQAELLGTGLTILDQFFETVVDNIEAAKNEAAGNEAILQSNLLDFNDALGEIFTSINKGSNNALIKFQESDDLFFDTGYLTDVYTDTLFDFVKERFIGTDREKANFNQKLRVFLDTIKEGGISAEEQIITFLKLY